MRSHVNLLGILHLVWGGMGLLLGASLLILAAGAAAIARTTTNEPMTAGFTAALFILFAAALVAAGLSNAWAGRAIRQHRSGGRLAALGSTSELKGVFRGRVIVEVQADDPVGAMRVLDTLPEVEKTSVFGTAVHAVLMHGAPAGYEKLREQLTAAGVAVRQIEPVEPSLEDVFLEVVSEAA